MKNNRTFLEKLLDGAEVEWKKLCEVSEIEKGKQLNKALLTETGEYPVINGGINPSGYWHEYNNEANTIVISQGGASAGYVNWMTTAFFAGAHAYVVKTNETLVQKRYAYHFLKMNQVRFMQNQYGAGIPALAKSDLENLLIPIPPLSVQTEIVKILDALTALTSELTSELTLRRKQYEYYREKLLSEEELEKVGFEWKTLDQISENLDSKRKPITSGLRTSGKIPYYGASGIVDYVKDYIFDGDFLLISEDGANLLARNTPIAFSASGKIWVNNHAHILKFETYEERRFIEFYLNKIDLTPYISGAAQPKLNKKNLNSIKFPIPSILEQQRIVSILDKFETLTNSITEGLPLAIEQSHKWYEYYRELLLNFPGRE